MNGAVTNVRVVVPVEVELLDRAYALNLDIPKLMVEALEQRVAATRVLNVETIVSNDTADPGSVRDDQRRPHGHTVSRWRIDIPSRGREQLLADCGFEVRHLPEAERLVTRAIIGMAAETGLRTAGELADHLERIGPQGRRELLDSARLHCDLPPVAEVEAREQFEALQATVKARPFTNEQGERLTSCAAEGCKSYPQDEHGAWRLVPDRKWWCPQHDHMRGEHDHLPPEPAYRIDPSTMTLEPLGAALERERKELRRLQAEDEQRAAEKLEEAQRRDRSRAARRAERPAGF